MRKKISLLLCTVAVMLCFTACGSSGDTVKYDEASLEQTAEFIIEYCASADEATVEQWRNMTDFSLELQLTQAGLPVTPESFLSAFDAWEAAVKDCGTYEGHGDFKYEATKDEIRMSADAQFSDRDATISLVFDENSYLDSITVDPTYSTGEILEKAGLNTILGMGTVFVVLIFISCLISLFKFIPALEKKFKKQPAQAAKKESTPVQSAPAQAAPAETVPETDDSELFAVIAAAIAAAQGETQATDETVSLEGFVVRSIKRRPSNKWNS